MLTILGNSFNFLSLLEKYVSIIKVDLRGRVPFKIKVASQFFHRPLRQDLKCARAVTVTIKVVVGTVREVALAAWATTAAAHDNTASEFFMLL